MLRIFFKSKLISCNKYEVLVEPHFDIFQCDKNFVSATCTHKYRPKRVQGQLAHKDVRLSEATYKILEINSKILPFKEKHCKF